PGVAGHRDRVAARVDDHPPRRREVEGSDRGLGSARVERIHAHSIVTPDGDRIAGAVAIDDGLIVAIEEGAAGDESTVAVLCPGFIDVQVNGIGAIDVATAADNDWDVLDASLLAQGVTTWCPTLVSAPLERFAAPLARIA